MAHSPSHTLRLPRRSVQQATQFSVKAIKSWLVPSYWEFVRKYIDDALKHANGELQSEDIYQYLLSERMYLFVVGKPTICGAATCEVTQYTRKKAIRVVTLGGENFPEWKSHLDDEFVKWAGLIKADGIETYVRKGLVGALEEIGYRQNYVGLWKEINGQKERAADGK